MAVGVGYLKDLRGWQRFGFGSRGNLIVYDDCLVFAAVREPLRYRVNVLERTSTGAARFERVAQEQAQLASGELLARDRHNWLVRTEEVDRAVVYATSGGAAAVGGDDVVDLVLGAALNLGGPTEHNLMISLKTRKTRMYPSVKGVWGDEENELLKHALGDRLVSRLKQQGSTPPTGRG